MAKKTIHDKRYRKILEKLIEARKEAGLTQEQVAKKINRPQSFVAKYENFERRLDVLEISEICKTLSVKLSELLKEIDN